MKEEELYRQIRIRARADELLSQSKMPKNMELVEQKKLLEQERELFFMKEMNRLNKERNRMAASSSASNSSSARNKMKMNKSHDVPDYDAMYKKFIIELETRKAKNRKHTKVEPFNLLTEERFRKDENADEQDSLRQQDAPSRASSASFSRSCNKKIRNLIFFKISFFIFICQFRQELGSIDRFYANQVDRITKAQRELQQVRNCFGKKSVCSNIEF
jgi:hypothetical protein